jgi:hypothetical protein
MIYEHRTYTTQPFRLREQLDLFSEHGLPVIAQHYGYPVLIGVQEDANVNSYVHIYQHESFEERFAKQAAMRADPAMRAYLDKVRAAQTVVEQRCTFLIPPAFFKPTMR